MNNGESLNQEISMKDAVKLKVVDYTPINGTTVGTVRQKPTMPHATVILVQDTELKGGYDPLQVTQVGGGYKIVAVLPDRDLNKPGQ
jgi:hypothetical protein